MWFSEEKNRSATENVAHTSTFVNIVRHCHLARTSFIFNDEPISIGDARAAADGCGLFVWCLLTPICDVDLVLLCVGFCR